MSSTFESMPYAQDANASAQSRQELQAKLNGLGGLNGRKLSPEAREKKLREACEGFESIFIQKMWQEMRNTVPKGGLLQGNEERFWQDMYDQELAKSMTSAGGIGLADMMYEQLSRNLVSASRSAVSQAYGGAFTPEAAPLVSMPEEEEAPAEQLAPVRTAAAIYEGEAPQAVQASLEEAIVEESPVAPVTQTPPVAQTAPAVEPARPEKAASTNRVKKSKSVKAHAPGESSGLQLAYLARRDAGDKLGANAVRPPLHSRKQSAHEEVEHAEAVNVDPNVIRQAGNVNPGSAEGLKAALAQAKSGSTELDGSATANLHNIVAAVQAQNSMNVQAPVQGASADVTETAAEPVTRKVRFTTNIPSRTKKTKKNDAIRMLNVDNVGVNSKQGQGLAAYHAAQEAAMTQAPAQAAQQVQPAAPEAAQAPISPLTAQSAQSGPEAGANFAIPPLKAGDLRG